jgi:hypothetical protein
VSKPDTSAKKSSGYFFGFGQSKISPTATAITEVSPALVQLENQKTFFKTQCVKGAAPMRCYVVRDKGMMGLCPTFRLYLESENGSQDKFLMSCTKSALATSGGYFLISIDKTPGDRESASTVGKLRCTEDGSLFHLYDNGENPKNFQDPSVLRKVQQYFLFHE